MQFVTLIQLVVILTVDAFLTNHVSFRSSFVTPSSTTFHHQCSSSSSSSASSSATISYEEMDNILCDFTVNEFRHAETPLLVTSFMTTWYRELEDFIQMNLHYKKLLQGPSGVGKTTIKIYGVYQFHWHI